jgi:multisubunit Na+/H+ antiporter MnhB subunit
MSENRNSVLIGVSISLLIFAAFMFILTREPFPHSSLVHSEVIPIQPGSEIGSSMSRFLWDFRGFDLTFQTLILFTTAICCLALLREEITK